MGGEMKKFLATLLCLSLFVGGLVFWPQSNPPQATIATEVTRMFYSGNGATTVFPYSFKIYAKTDLLVIIRDADGNETTQTVDSDYTVSGIGVDAGGNVTMAVAPADTEKLLILRNRPLKQETDYIEGGPFLADSHEDALDELTMLVQQLQEQLDRSIHVKKSSTLTDLEFSDFDAGEYVRVNLTGDGLDSVDAVYDLGNFLQSGTGAVSRTAASKMGEIVSIADFGPSGDGITNDLSAFNACIAAAGINGIIIVPYTGSGYLIEGELTLLARQILFGLGKPTLKFNTTGVAITTGQYGAIKNLIIENNGGTSSGVLIKARTIARNLEIDGFNTAGKYGLKIDTTENLCRIENVTITDCDDGLVIDTDSNGNLVQHVDVRGCDEVATSTGITVQGKANIINVVSQSNAVGIKLLTGATQNLIHLYKENNTTPGEFDVGANGNMIVDYGPGYDYADFTDNGTDNIVWSAKHGAGFEWIFNKVLAERFEVEDRSKVGSLALIHNDDRDFRFQVSGSAADQEFFFENSQAGKSLSVYVDGVHYSDGGYIIRGATNGQQCQILQATTEKTGLAGATVTWANAIPAGTTVFGVTARVTTLITGATSIDIGDGTDVDIFIDGMAVALDTTADLANCNDGTLLPTTYKANTDIVLTAIGGNFTAGAIRLTVYYLNLVPPTS